MVLELASGCVGVGPTGMVDVGREWLSGEPSSLSELWARFSRFLGLLVLFARGWIRENMVEGGGPG